MRSIGQRPLASLLLVLVALGAVAAPASAQEPQASLPDIEDEVMCPTCGFSLELSESPQADQIRDYIREAIADGQTKQQILDGLVVEYGPEVLATPETEGFDLAAWVVPILGVLAAAAAIAVGARRWRREGDGGDSEPAGPAAGIDPGDEARLRDDRARYEL
jgi:cytochrome c-type biogenesis protein CcmH